MKKQIPDYKNGKLFERRATELRQRRHSNRGLQRIRWHPERRRGREGVGPHENGSETGPESKTRRVVYRILLWNVGDTLEIIN